MALEAEKVKELVDHRSSEASRLWVFRDTVSGDMFGSILMVILFRFRFLERGRS